MVGRAVLCTPRVFVMLFAAIGAPSGRCFVHDDLAQARALGLQFLPEPLRHVFDRWVVQAFDVIEVFMVQQFQKWSHRLADLRVVVNPPGFGIHVTFNRHFDFETVSVQPAAFVTLMRLWQDLCRFEREILR